jgi:16S rRNA (adenine1518-N6/adenine1519-N6)-dimethyltransferase
VPPAAFTPPPKVVSSVVELIPRERPAPCDRDLLTGVAQAAFGQRRKMLRQSLKSFAASRGLDVAAWLERAGIEPTRRAEEIDGAGFVALAQAAAEFTNSINGAASRIS